MKKWILALLLLAAAPSYAQDVDLPTATVRNPPVGGDYMYVWDATTDYRVTLANLWTQYLVLQADTESELEGILTDVSDVLTDNDTDTISFDLIDFSLTLAGNPALAVDECYLVATTGGGGFICEGSSADTNEQLYLFPDVNGSDTTSEITALGQTIGASELETDAVTLTVLDDDANTPTAGDLVVVETGAASVDYLTPNAGTDVTADLEEETHASEHSDGGADEITAENLATSCTDGQILEALSGGWVCGTDDSGGGGANSFETMNAPSGTDPVADSATDTLNLTSSSLTITGTAGTDTLDFEIGTAAVGATELDEAGVEAGLESVLDLQDLQGAVTDGQVPDTITVNLAATATALAANGANCTAGNYPLGVDASGAVESCTADSDTQLSQEQVEDYVGGMVTGNTETQIAVTYQDGDGTLDFVVDTLGGDVTGTLGATVVGDDSHSHTTTTISGLDISDDTNLAVGDGVALTGDTVSLDLIDDGDAQSATTASESGLEHVSGELGLIRGCADGEILEWNDTTGDWNCGTDDAGGGGANSFETWNAPAGTDPVADSATDTINLTSDTLTITGTAATDTLDLEIATAAVGATELDEADVEAGLEAVLDLPDLQGAVTDAQVPDTITINLAATATALAANGANCTAGQYPLGVNASGAVESCTADSDTQLTEEQVEDFVGGMVAGNTETDITVTYQDGDGTLDFVVSGHFVPTDLDTDYGAETVTSAWDLSGADLEVPNATTLPSADCDAAGEAGRIHVDTDATSGQQLYVCEGASGWVLQGDGGGAPGTDSVGTAELDDDANSPTAGDFVVVETGAASFDYVTPNAGTDVSADLEEETHASEHAENAADEILGESLGTACTDGQVLKANASGGLDCGTDTDTNTQLSQEQVEDFAGGMWTGNTETGLTVTYQDADGTIDAELDTLGGDVTGTIGAMVVGNDSHNHTTTTISGLDISDDTNLAVTAPITLTGDTVGITLPTHSLCAYIEDPVTAEEFYTIWRAPAAVTVTEIYCEATGGTSVALDLEVDDGTPTGVNGSDITCTTSGVTDSTFAGDATLADGNRLDLDFGTVTGSVDAISVCWEYTYD